MFTCTFCSTNYATQAQLHQHNLDTHSQQLPFRTDYIYVCMHPTCYEMSKNGVTLKSHYEIEHNNTKATQTNTDETCETHGRPCKETFIGIQIDDFKKLIKCATPQIQNKPDKKDKKSKK